MVIFRAYNLSALLYTIILLCDGGAHVSWILLCSTRKMHRNTSLTDVHGMRYVLVRAAENGHCETVGGPFQRFPGRGQRLEVAVVLARATYHPQQRPTHDRDPGTHFSRRGRQWTRTTIVLAVYRRPSRVYWALRGVMYSSSPSSDARWPYDIAPRYVTSAHCPFRGTRALEVHLVRGQPDVDKMFRVGAYGVARTARETCAYGVFVARGSSYDTRTSIVCATRETEVGARGVVYKRTVFALYNVRVFRKTLRSVD